MIVQESVSGDDEAPGALEDPWRTLRRQQDRRRYLRILTPRRIGKERPKRPSPAIGVPRTHPLLGSPASVTRAVAHIPNQQDVRAYLRHSCDITMRGGSAGALVYPLAVCALAEHYVFRRIGGSSTGAAAAAAAAAAELGRGAPDPDRPPELPNVVPGFAGLAQAVGWLAGQDVRDARDAQDTPETPDTGEQHRLARLFQPAGETHGLFRMLLVLLRSPGQRVTLTLGRLVAAGAAVPGFLARATVGLIWLGFAFGWLGLTAALVAGARAGAVSPWVTIGAAVVLLVGIALAGALATVVVELVAVLNFIRSGAERQHYGLVPGVTPRSSAWQRRASWLDRKLNVPEAGDVPALMTWLADRLDDLAGIPPGADRHALTFGDLWRGEAAAPGPGGEAAVRLAALERESRVIDLTLVATDLSERRPYRFPLPPADRAERSGGTRFLFCEACLAAVLPQRLVTQMVKAAPSTDTDHTCPRHRDAADTGVLRELPDPWDVPVAFAMRLSFSPPGLIWAVPLYSVAEVARPARYDQWGQLLEPAPEPVDDPETTVRTHWFCDAGVSNSVPVNYFDVLLPRWPTFGLNVEPVPQDAPEELLRLPGQDAAPSRRSWRSLESAASVVSAILDAAIGGRDRIQAEMPGFRGRIAIVRQLPGERGLGFLLPQETILAVALRGLRAGEALRERFTGSDDDVPGQTQTDRYRWIRLRMALREYRGMSVDIGARLPLYRDLASSYHVPAALSPWFDPPLPPAERDPIWADAGTVVTTLRAMSTGGVLDFDADRGAPPADPDLRLIPPE